MDTTLTLTFGKYKDRTIHDVFIENPSYITWLIKKSWFKQKFTKEYQMCMCLSKQNNVEPINDSDLVIYTDGACSNNGKANAKAGIGIHFSKRNNTPYNDTSQAFTDKPTNQRAELKAILVALQIVQNYSHKIIIYTDSEYSINCVTKWFPNWVKQNKVDDKKNIDLIKPIYRYLRALSIEFRHINSHTGLQDEHSLGNEEADRLANAALNLNICYTING